MFSKILVANRGEIAIRAFRAAYEVGARTEAIQGLQSSLSVWKLDVGSELVFVGDAGTTSPIGPAGATASSSATATYPGTG